MIYFNNCTKVTQDREMEIKANDILFTEITKCLILYSEIKWISIQI